MLLPALGFVFGIVLMIAVSWVCVRQTPHKVDRWFHAMQFVAAVAW